MLYVNYTSIRFDLEEKKEVGARGGRWACGRHMGIEVSAASGGKETSLPRGAQGLRGRDLCQPQGVPTFPEQEVDGDQEEMFQKDGGEPGDALDAGEKELVVGKGGGSG